METFPPAGGSVCNHRLDVTFTHGNRSYTVPGYFAADGDAANSSATSGNKWRVKFTPDNTGIWNYSVSFCKGTDVAASMDSNVGIPLSPDGASGTFTIGPADPRESAVLRIGMGRAGDKIELEPDAERFSAAGIDGVV